MFRRGLVLSLVLGFASIANADAVIELTALTPENAVGGYLPGTTVDFQAAISRSDASGGAISLRLVTLDFSASSAALTFTGPDNFPVNPGPDGIEEFVFDFSSLPSGAFYGQFPNYPKSNVTYSATSEVPGFMLVIPATGAGSLVLGTGSVVLPSAPDKYLVDALNAGSTSTSDSARIDFDFVNPTTWLANGMGTGLITGDALSLTVVPEPATLILLGLGGLAAIRRRRHRA